jgi:putative addiction module component (TIGR02574 family)
MAIGLRCKMKAVTPQELENEALKLDIASRAKLAGKLLSSLEDLSPDEVTRVWAEEAQRRDAEIDSDPGSAIPADAVFREVRSSVG